ncbi:MAG TPA: FAD-dependent monooxygenase [Xanthobacteraceae bacterium]|nr:FAD-dependent monooxygenase [Xanthobacteraceae bacterium]
MSKPGNIIIVGAGPAGVVCALALSRRGIPVTVLEQEPAPVKDQRAASIHPPTLEMLDEIGITTRIIDKGLVSSKYRFHDRLDGSVVAEFDLDRMRDEFKFPFVLQYEQYKLTAAVYQEYANGSDFDVRFSHRVESLSQDGAGVTVDVISPSGRETHRADYVIGCDGGRSTVRKLADIDFKGFRYPEKFIKIATSFDFGEVNSHLVFRNYFSDPDEWCNLFKVRGEREPGLWRAIFPTQVDEPDEIALAPDRIEARLQRFFPKSGRYEIEYVNVYNVAQCVAETFRKGRVLLAGDSAHVNNPIGGMGMNGGMHDAFNLAEKLAAVIHGTADDDVLDLYDRQRRYAAVTYVQAQTIANKRLMEERDPAVRSRNFAELKRTSEDPESAKAYMRRAALLESLNSAAGVA